MNNTYQSTPGPVTKLPAKYYSVTGVLKLADGNGRVCKVLVPCVYPADWELGVDDVCAIGRDETALVALELARRTNPGCLWVSVDALDIRPANAGEHAWAQLNGVDQLFSRGVQGN